MQALLLLLPSDSEAIDRCKKYQVRVIRESRYFLGKDAPWWYFMAQIEVESRCNETITAFDGGMGLGQFMPETARWIHNQEKALQEFDFNPYDPAWNIRAMILYDRYCYENTLCTGWYYAFRVYNGGIAQLNREIKLAGVCKEEEVEKFCNRRKIRLKSGILDLCEVNIKYPYKIFSLARRWR
ncbi:MAG TPA: lytic transglycosylase domain-containing protein [Candidatus Hydrothermia bacterium]|nr:lytic transglycosylase domain-containing protein [Candidatus Hydrothermia bacterium]